MDNEIRKYELLQTDFDDWFTRTDRVEVRSQALYRLGGALAFELLLLLSGGGNRLSHGLHLLVLVAHVDRLDGRGGLLGKATVDVVVVIGERLTRRRRRRRQGLRVLRRHHHLFGHSAVLLVAVAVR